MIRRGCTVSEDTCAAAVKQTVYRAPIVPRANERVCRESLRDLGKPGLGKGGRKMDVGRIEIAPIKAFRK